MRLFFVAPITFSPMKHENFRNFSTRGGGNSVFINYAKIREVHTLCDLLDREEYQLILSFFETEEVFSEREIAIKLCLELDVTQEYLKDLVRTNVLEVFWENFEKRYIVNNAKLEAVRNFYTTLNAYPH